MIQKAFDASDRGFSDSYDFDENYEYLKRLIQDLKKENRESIRKELFGNDEPARALTKKEMKQLFRFLRKIENHYEECTQPPIPPELEDAIRSRESSDWLPWELEAIEKVDMWRAKLEDSRQSAREMFEEALQKIRAGEKIK
jgi:hypothetical protein